MESEPQPRFNFPWHEDEDGYYILLKTDMGVNEIRPDNTEIYTYTDYPEADYIWHKMYEGDDEVRHGYRIYRDHVDRAICEGAFEAMIWSMQQHDFEIIEEEEPNESDWYAFREKYDRDPVAIDRVEQVVKLAMKNLDAEWKYVQAEEGWH